MAIPARPNPVRTTANDSSGAPPRWASGSSGPSAWLNPTTPQGNPPNGTVDLAHSWAAHSPANQTGQPDSRRTATASTPNSPGNTAWSTASASQGKTPTNCPVHGSSGT